MIGDMEIDLNEIVRSSLPQWSVAEFVFLESTPQWAPAVQAELIASQPQQSSTTIDFRCSSVTRDREVIERIQGTTPAGVILFAADRFRECLLLLGRLGRLCRPTPDVLVVIPSKIDAMTPLLLESGATTVFVGDISDIRIAEWCRRVARRAC